MVLLASAWSGTRIAQPGEQLVTDYYIARIAENGSLDLFALNGTRLVFGLPRFKARYFFAGEYSHRSSDRHTAVRITEQDDSILVSSDAPDGPVDIGCCCALSRHSPFVECRGILSYESPIDSVFFESLEFDVMPVKAAVVGRDQKLAPPSGKAKGQVLDRWTTRAGRFGEGRQSVTLPGEDNLMSLRVARAGDLWHLTYDIDRDCDHPFFRGYRYVAGHGYFDSLCSTSRPAGSSQEWFFRLALGSPVRILKKERQPDGYEATLVMTEHADDEGPATTRAIAFGSSESDTPIPGRGILGNGLTWTKSVFRWHTDGSYYARLGYSGLDQPDFKSVTDNLYARGVEIALHSPSALPDSAGRVGAALRDMSSWYHTRVWIDHGMDVNFEAISKFGAVPESTGWYIADTLPAYGIEYVWQASDMNYLGGWGNSLFTPQKREFHPPVLYRNARLGPKLYLWPAFAVNRNRERDYHLSPEGIDRLVASRGIDVLHVYFAGQDTYIGRPQPASTGWLIPHGLPPHLSWETDPAVDRYFRNIAEKQAAGRVRVTTLSAMADYLLLADSVELQAQVGGDFLVVNHAHRPDSGFALSTAAEGITGIKVDGQEVTSRKQVGQDVLFWLDVPANAVMKLHIQAPVQPNPLGHGTTLFWQVDRPGHVSVRIYSSTGRLVRTLSDLWQEPGDYRLNWDTRDDRGRLVPAGDYLCRLQAGSSSQSRKLVVVR